MSSDAGFEAVGLAWAGAVAAVVLLAGIASARRTGLADDGSDAPGRKEQRRAVPLVGGPALLAALLALSAWASARGADALAVFAPDPDAWCAFEAAPLALAAALSFATGLVDDLAPRGLGPAAKLAGQTAAGLALASGLLVVGEPPGPLARALAVLVAVAAQNVANGFDHADGMLGSAAAAAFLAARANFVGALAVFLVANLARPARGGAPFAFLGDSGSHLLGILLLATPAGQAALVLPALDFARVVLARWRAGDPICCGDRRHLGQRLADGGRVPAVAAALSLLAAAPAFAAHAVAEHGLAPRGIALVAGGVLCALALAGLLAGHPDRHPNAG